MSAADQGRARQALAFVAQTLRPDWDPPGIIAAIEALHRDRQPLGLIARATISAALTPTTKTPGGIAARIRDGFDGAETPTRTPDNSIAGKCPRCPAWTIPGDGHACTPASPTDEYRKARAELDAARAGMPAKIEEEAL